jgi:hypothetical protein
LLIYYFEVATKGVQTKAAQPSPITTAQSYKFFHLSFLFYKAMAAMTAAPIIPAPTLKPLPALVVAVAGAEDEAFEAADEAELAAVVDAVAAAVPVAVAVTADDPADDTLDATEAVEEAEDDTADAAVDAAEVALVEAPLAVAIEQISLVTLVVAVA